MLLGRVQDVRDAVGLQVRDVQDGLAISNMDSVIHLWCQSRVTINILSLA